MKILYAIQGTGNGHLSRSMDIVPLLKQMADVDVLVSGTQGDLSLPFEVKYKFHGFGFIFGKSGGVDVFNTFYKSRALRFIKEVQSLNVHAYDLIINDFEPVSSWACKFRKKACISLSHQSAVLSPNSPKAESADTVGKFILANYAPSTYQYGFHFSRYDDNIFTPVIRQQVRNQVVENRGHYTVYLPAYDDTRLINKLSQFEDVRWDVFSKHNKKEIQIENVMLQPVNNEKFIKSMASAAGILCGAGFETPAEALFMKKKLLVIPMKRQYEQHLNAAALHAMGVPVINSLKAKYDDVLTAWLKNDKVVEVSYPDNTREILELIIAKHTPHPVVA
jgi:uncharacterized protein (TIGR00661 family)